MISEHSENIAARAKEIYSSRLRQILEARHSDRFVAIEPDSGEYFLGDTFSQAVAEARAAYPERISFVIRVGHPAALHMGGVIR